MKKFTSVLFLFLVVGVSHAAEVKVTPSDGAAVDRFGFSVSISGDYAVVGAHFDDDNGRNSGSAYVFIRSRNNWIQQLKLIPSDGAAGDQFGNSVAISGDYAIVGAWLDDDAGSGSGSAYIFMRSGNNWIQQLKLTASDGARSDHFGISVSISGDYAVVGALDDDDNGFDSGSAYVFIRSGNNWTQQAKLTPSDGATSDEFGYSTAISGDYAIVGAWGDDDNGSSSGSAYSFLRNGLSWSEKSKVTPSDGARGDFFGFSVSISGDYAIVGANQDDDNGGSSGSAYIYHSIDDLSLPVQFKPHKLQFTLWGQVRKNALYQNFPNPFNPETWIPYQLSTETNVEISIYSVNGHHIRALQLGIRPSGEYITKDKAAYWNGRSDTGERVSSGAYFYHFRAGDYSVTRKMIILK